MSCSVMGPVSAPVVRKASQPPWSVRGPGRLRCRRSVIRPRIMRACPRVRVRVCVAAGPSSPPWMSWNVMFCHAARRKCHGLSWSAAPPVPPPPVRIPHAVPPSRSVPFSPPPAPPCGGTLFRAYRARARPRVGAGAVRAPDCPRARGRAQGARLPSVFRGSLKFAPARTGKRSGSAEAVPFLPPLSGCWASRNQPLFVNYF